MSDHPFAALERSLGNPRASGLMVHQVTAASPAAAAGLNLGDIITAVDGVAVISWGALLSALQPGTGNPSRSLTIVRPSGELASVTLPCGRPRLDVTPVHTGRSAWHQVADYADVPDLSGQPSRRETWWRVGFEDVPAGYERERTRGVGEVIEIDHFNYYGGDDGNGGTFTHRSRIVSRHRADRWLSPLALRWTSDAPPHPAYTKQGERQADGRWAGSILEPGQPIQHHTQVMVPDQVASHTVPLLATTLPLRLGASLTFTLFDEGDGMPIERSRLECLGRRPVRLLSGPSSAWCMAWRHYGETTEREVFWVDDQHGLVRIEWGPTYRGAWSERIEASQAGVGLPPHITVVE